jgi:hypothetical protein
MVLGFNPATPTFLIVGIGKKKMIEDIQETDPIDVVITFVDTK